MARVWRTVAAGLLTAAVGLVGAVSAADLPLKAPPTPAPIGYDWSGAYVGAHIGGALAKETFADPSGIANINLCCGNTYFVGGASTDAKPSSFIGGGQVGWMYQIARLVVGGEVDLSWTHLNGSGAAFYLPWTTVGNPENATEAYSVHTKWIGTATTIIGIARDRLLLFAKAGGAWAHNGYTVGITGIQVSPGYPAFAFPAMTVSNTVYGWTTGTGVRVAVTNQLFVNLEYDFIYFGSKTQNFSSVCALVAGGACVNGNTNPSTFNPTFYQHVSEVKAGINYKFAQGFLFW